MTKKLIFYLGAVTVALAISTVGWFLLKGEDKHLKATPVDTEVTSTVMPTESTQSLSKAEEAQRTPAERTVERTRQTLNTFYQETGQVENPYVQQLMRAMESPAYEEYMKQQHATPGFSFKLYFDFLESQGVESHRDMYENNFRQYYPTGTLASYEPMMRKRLAEHFLDATPIDPTDLGAVTQQISEVMEAFDKVPEQRNWVLANFLGEGEWDWATDIQKNAASILAESTESLDMLEPTLFTDIEPDEAFSFTRQPTTENIDIPSEPEHLSEILPPLEALEPIPENAGALEAELIKDIFADIPDLPTEADFQKTLRERFSPQRFNTAMQTLNQYGPEEGLRRLKASDPEMATHVERLIQPNKETD